MLNVSRFKAIPNFNMILQDLCSHYQLNESHTEELTELAYILYESFKDSLVQSDLVKCKMSEFFSTILNDLIFFVFNSAPKVEIADFRSLIQLS